MLEEEIRTLSENLSALRDFVSLIDSVLDEHNIDLLNNHSVDLLPQLIGNLAATPHLAPDALETLRNIRAQYSDEFTVTPDGPRYATVQFHNGEAAQRFQKVKVVWDRQAQHRSLLYKSAIISLNSATEWFLSRLLRLYFLKYPDAAGIKDKTLTLEELRAIGTIDEAQEHLIDLRIQEIMRGAFDDWCKFLKSNLKLTMTYLEPHKDTLVEIFQRRNLVIHHNGVVNALYLSKVASALRSNVKTGDTLDIDIGYLQKAIDHIQLCFTLIAAELWKQLDPKDDNRASVLTEVAIESLTAERWEVAEGLSLFTMNDKHLPERSLLNGQFNYWQSKKWKGQFEGIRSAVEAADFSAKDDLFDLARYVLLDEFDKALAILPDLLRSGKLGPDQLKDWPLFREFRKTSAYELRVNEFLPHSETD